jgi:hypothetical protein
MGVARRPKHVKEVSTIMTINRYLRLIAGFFVMLGVVLADYHSPYWLLFTGFFGQPVPERLHRLVPDDAHSAQARREGRLRPELFL